MRIFVLIKCGLADAANFITQISSLQDVNEVSVFRDEEVTIFPKVNYIINNETSSVYKFIKRFFKVISSNGNKPDYIVGIYEIPHGLLAVIASKVLRTKSVVSIIGNPAYKKIRKGLRLFVTNRLLHAADAITVTGSNSRNYLISCGFSAKKVFILPNTMDFIPFKKLDIEKEYDIVSLGRISEEKRLDILLSVVKKLKVNYPKIKAAIGGRGPELSYLEQLIKNYDLLDNVTLYGFIPDDDLNLFFNKGKIFVLTSETEGFPRTIIQASACGVPVVSSNVGDVCDVIDSGNDGFLIEKFDDIEAYTNCIKILLENDQLYNQFSTKLCEKVRTYFNTANASKVWSDIFTKLN